MNPELRSYIEHARYTQGALRGAIPLLPADDAELDQWIGESVASAHPKEFIFLLVAAQDSGRKVQALHLVGGAALMLNAEFLACAAWKMEGDVAANLMAALQSSQLHRSIEAMALYIAALSCQEQGRSLPPQLIPKARTLARSSVARESDVMKFAALAALGFLSGDAALKSLIAKNYPALNNETLIKSGFTDPMAGVCRGPLVDLFPEQAPRTLANGRTMRRAVARLGRNEPCHCGSGKKYKHCCIGKDDERLHHSSNVAGATREELYVDPNQGITLERIHHAAVFELVQFDPRRIPTDLLVQYLLRLIPLAPPPRVAEVIEQLGPNEEVKKVLHVVYFLMAQKRRKDVIVRVRKVYPDAPENELDAGTRLMLAEEDPAKLLAVLDELALRAAKSEDHDELLGIAFGILFARPALGLHIARSLLLAIKKDIGTLFDEILKVRDHLNLPPDDPFADIVDELIAGQPVDEAKDAEALRAAQRAFDSKAREVQELKETLRQLQKEIDRREQHASPQPSAVIVPLPTDESVLKELRRKVDELKESLNERHNERNELRRELQKAQSDLETLRQSSTANAAPEPEDTGSEDELLLPQDVPEVHPLRLIEFPKGFLQRLEGYPRHVARAVLTLAGRLAAGEPAAYVGALRLKATPDVMRQRIGSDYRLLFRLSPAKVEIIDLINRKDLERRIKAMT